MRIELRLATPAEWIKVFDPRDATIVVEGDRTAVGTDVRLDLTIEAGPRIVFRGQVIAHRGGNARGVLVALGPTEREKVNYLNGFVRGGLLDLRTLRRLPVRLPITYGGLDGPCQAYSRDINEQGVFVVTEDPLPEEAEVHLLITFPGARQPVSTIGVVSHTVVVEDEDTPGMGIVFTSPDAERKPLVDAVERLDQAFRTGALPEDVLV
ncbi:MAG TPA: PilZ domain-containing protein [Kofleriaceae bacterium]|nr:PilZ domain-containing protein [Kofleriaceae bacterium]